MSPPVLVETRGHLGLLTLNRPQALNALTTEMVDLLARALDRFEHDPAIQAVLVKGAGEKAFCAGGDIRALYDWGKARDPLGLAFYAQEYRLNHRIATFPKPYIAWVDGIVMGGGVGVSIHGQARIFTERATFAMPETGIGLFPDVGGSYFLSRLPGAVGTYLGLTGARVKRADALDLGLASHGAASSDLDQVVEGLAAGRALDDVLAPLPREPGGLQAARAWIDDAFALASMEAILDRLTVLGQDAVVTGLRAKSPTSLKVTLRQLREGAGRDLAACLTMEYRMTHRFMSGHDFFEGVRAVILDKDNAPQWQPERLEDVSDGMIEAYFDQVPDELEL